MEEDEASEYSRSCSPESLASTGTGNMDPTEYYSDEEEDLVLDESLEQTIAGDLETLTDSGSTVNQLELEQQKAWREYVRVKEEGLRTLQALKKKLHSSIDKTEPFVEMWRKARQLQNQAHSATVKFERAHSEYESAKETLRIAEDGIADLEVERKRSRDDRSKSPVCQIDEAWQETLSNATERVRTAGQIRLESEIEHRRLTVEFQKCQAEYKEMEKRLKKAIKKSRPYYETRYKCNQRLVEIKKRIEECDRKLSQHKSVYRSTMKHLETLNYLLHEHKDRRRANSALATSSEPNLLQRRAQTPDFPLTCVQRMAITPDEKRRKDIVNTISFSFKGSAGCLPTVRITNAAATNINVCSAEQRRRDVRKIVSNSLSRALKRFEQDDPHGGSEDSGDLGEEVQSYDYKVRPAVRIEVEVESNGDSEMDRASEKIHEIKGRSHKCEVQNVSQTENYSSAKTSDRSQQNRKETNDIDGAGSNPARYNQLNDSTVIEEQQSPSNSVKLKTDHSTSFVPKHITSSDGHATPPTKHSNDSSLLSTRFTITY